MQQDGSGNGNQSSGKGLLKQGLYLQSTAGQVNSNSCVCNDGTPPADNSQHNSYIVQCCCVLQKRDYAQRSAGQPAASPAAVAAAPTTANLKQAAVGTAAAGVLRAGPGPASYRRTGNGFLLASVDFAAGTQNSTQPTCCLDTWHVWPQDASGWTYQLRSVVLWFMPCESACS